jgi:hypothetical protein
MELGTGTSDKARLEWECHTVSLFVAWGLKVEEHALAFIFGGSQLFAAHRVPPHLPHLHMRESERKSIIYRIFYAGGHPS